MSHRDLKPANVTVAEAFSVLGVPCPKCRAAAGEPCTTATGKRPHHGRLLAAQRDRKPAKAKRRRRCSGCEHHDVMHRGPKGPCGEPGCPCKRFTKGGKTSPTQRSLAWARDRGLVAGVVERWNPHARVRQDLFGFIDIVAVGAGDGVLAIQATTAPNLGARVDKINDEPRARAWLEAGGRVEAHGWRRLGKRGARRWTLRRMALELVAGELRWEDVDGER